MSSGTDFKPKVSITHIGTATAILEIDGVRFLTDPFFSPAGTTWDVGITILKNTEDPALTLDQLPPIDAVLLSHEDHPDNLDELGRRLLDGRHVFTTMDGAKNLAPRPAVNFRITATPCQHMPGGECIGFLVSSDDFGIGPNNLPNAIYFTGDTVYIDELTNIADKHHIPIAMMNLGFAHVKLPDMDTPLQITMDGKQAARLFREIKADHLVPMHYDKSWGHFTQFEDGLARDFKDEGVDDKVKWLKPGVPVEII
ncbi:zn-dependent hydrolases of the beta-lactamase [Colletotrichum camelliae]|nr:zn-dependent hydrolases of the beta-lactamase [Colletotrichum camelliae]